MELVRLREALAASESREGVKSDDMGIAGRVGLTRLRDVDFPEIAKAVERFPEIYEKGGHLAGLAYGRNVVRTLVDAIIFSQPMTADLIQSTHRLHAMLTEGQVEIMYRRDNAGIRGRIDFLEAVERYAFAPSIKAAFSRGVETPAGLVGPTTYQPRQ